LTLNKKIRNGQILYFNYILVVGEEEINTGVFDLRDTKTGDRVSSSLTLAKNEQRSNFGKV